jgi:tripartite-type tricarboxylate transporter receptor subunit TctC
LLSNASVVKGEIEMNIAKNLVAGLLFAAVASTAQSQSFPTKNITIISPFAPGGTSDFVGRVVAQKMMENTGWKIIIESKPGANGQIGSDLVAKAAPDGYTLVLGPSSTHGIQPSLFKKLPYDVLRDFAGITMLGATANIIAVNPALPVHNVKELIAYGKANPGKLNFSSPGTGTSVHISGEMFKDAAGIDMLHVPYKGSGPSMAAVLGGEVQVLFENISAAVPNVKAGRLRPIAVTSITRSSALPEVPTLNESGLAGFEVLAWFGMFAPAATPKEVIARLNAEFVKALRDPKISEAMLSRGLEPRPMTPDEFTAIWHKDVEKYAAIVKKAKITVE